MVELTNQNFTSFLRISDLISVLATSEPFSLLFQSGFRILHNFTTNLPFFTVCLRVLLDL